MPHKTNADYIRDLRERRERLGLVRKEIWTHPDDYALIQRFADKLLRKRQPITKAVAIGRKHG